MARRNSRGLELTFHKATKRWCKVVNGKRYYFGGGKGISDRISYRDALTKYRHWKEEREKRVAEEEELIANQRFGGLLTDALAYVHRQLDEPGRFLLGQYLKDLAMHDSITIVDEETGDRSSWRKGEPSHDEEYPDVATLVDKYRQVLDRRYEQTQQDASFPKKKQLGGSGYRNAVYSINAMSGHFATVGLSDFRNARATEAALASWRRDLEDEVASGRLKGSTVEARTKHVKPFFDWAWRNRLIEEIPRNVPEVTAKFPSVPSAKPLSVDDVQRLWRVATDPMRCWISLALNCGYYAMDIATLRDEHIIDGKYVARFRNKTKIPTKHLLWPVTHKLIAKTRNGRDGLLFQRKNGEPLVVEKPGTGKKYDGIANRFSRLTQKAGVKASFSQFRDTSACMVEELASIQAGVMDKTLASQFLGHADRRMAKFYLENEPGQLETAKLDKVIRKMGKSYSLRA